MQLIKRIQLPGAWSALIWSAVVLTVLEALGAFLHGTYELLTFLTEARFVAGLFLAFGLSVFAQLGVLWLLASSVSRASKRPRLAWLLCAAVFGWLWQSTLMQGEGIQAHAHFELTRLFSFVAGPSACVAFAWGVLLAPRSKAREAVVVGAIAGAVGFNHYALPSYRYFHGYLALAAAILLAWLLAGHMRSAMFRRLGLLPAVLFVAACVWLWGARRAVEGNILRFTRMAAPALEASPLTRPLLAEIGPLASASRPVSRDVAQAFDKHLQANARPSGPPRGRNVLLIVLEAVRADSWSDKAITPGFHRWRRHGLYVPRAVAQYPATLLAYGAIFASQYPSVLAQSGHWARDRLFDEIRPRFDRLILTRPHVRWFAYTTITDFFVDLSLVRRHRNAAGGLSFIKRQLKTLGPRESFFAWAHLYEPHFRYVKHRGFDFGNDPRGRYLSEVAWVDFHLAAFMRWFFRQPCAKETLVLVLSDHGQGLGEVIFGSPFFGHHVHVHSLLSHIPLFLAGPGIPQDVVARDLAVAQVDVMPTIFDFLGMGLPPRYAAQGTSIYRLMDSRQTRALVSEAFGIRGVEFFGLIRRVARGQPWDRRQSYRRLVVGGHYPPKFALERYPHKLVYDLILDRYWVYDLRRDRMESRDLSSQSPSLQRSLRKAMDVWQQTQALTLRKLSKL